MSKITITASSRVGCIRSNNEDMILVENKYVRSEACDLQFFTENKDRFIVALADGMGGHNAGEVASEETLRNLHFFIHDLPAHLSEGALCEAMVEWLVSINKIISSRGVEDRKLQEMGTTLVGILYYEGNYFWMNCGDSRLYMLSDGKLKQITTDHSLNEMTGVKRHSNVITNCIGAGCTTSFLDFTEFTNDVQAGCTFLLCSDGLSDMVDDENIEKLLNEGKDANALCEAAITAGGFDNVSACVVAVAESH